MMRPLPALVILAALLRAAAPTAAQAAQDKAMPPQTQPAHQHDEHHHDATMTHSFEDVQHWVEVFDDPNRAAWQKPELLPGILGLRPGDVVADIGAGTGYFNKVFAGAVGPSGRVYAADIEPGLVAYMLERAAREATPTVIPTLVTPDNPLLPPGGVDVVFVCNTWHHINDRLGYLALLQRALKPSGRLVIVDFQKQELPVGPPVEHKLSRDEVVAELAEAGWSLKSESAALPYQYALTFIPRAAPK